MKPEFDLTKMVEEMAMQAKENLEEFIIETIFPYCENILQIKINKEELKQILLNGIQKQQQGWIPVKWHKRYVDEYEEYPDDPVTIDSPMPEDGQEILITVKNKSGYCWVEKTIACYDSSDGWYTEDDFAWVDDIIAWMPLPEPYKAERSESE